MNISESSTSRINRLLEIIMRICPELRINHYADTLSKRHQFIATKRRAWLGTIWQLKLGFSCAGDKYEHITFSDDYENLKIFVTDVNYLDRAVVIATEYEKLSNKTVEIIKQF